MGKIEHINKDMNETTFQSKLFWFLQVAFHVHATNSSQDKTLFYFLPFVTVP